MQGSNSRIIASNSVWNIVEVACGFVATFATAIPMARIIGPERLGYYNYVQWLINISGLVGLLGIPGATRKYMAEYLGANEPEIAKAVFRNTFRIQAVIAFLITASGLGLVLWGAPEAYKWISFFLVLSLFPSMVASIPSQANVAAERMVLNTVGSMASYAINIAAVTLSLVLGWDLLGIAIGVCLFRAVDCAVRLLLVNRWLSGFARIPLPSELKRKMRTFSGYNLALMILNTIVWDRSDMFFLQKFGRDAAEISFFSAAVGLVEKVQLMPSAFGTAAFATIQAQFGRDRSELSKLASNALWYAFAFSMPLLLGLAVVGGQLLPLLYGSKYAPAVPVLTVAALLAIPKCLAAPAWSVMEAESRQGFLVVWLILCAIVNIAADILLIPARGAMGAAFANGIAQLLLVAGIVWRVHFLFGLNFRFGGTVKLLFSGIAMTGAVLAFPFGSKLWTMPAKIILGVVVFAAIVHLTRAFGADDRERLLLLKSSLPARFRPSFVRLVCFLAPLTPQQEPVEV
ncbi:MAG TPA: polysaccharide biosynthesis C-terminal domain-containing protein [Bryobacteraceae bacterium]|nr:polysaccharide biosynthesis C-terminal domain-containing protein [Bryobacteraceae bacterium]